jgi:hypothetical protein
MPVKIYALRDGHWIRYVGKTIKSLDRRLSGHLLDARKNRQDHRSNGIREILKRGCLPSITLIEIVRGDGNKEEKSWIQYFKSHGIALWNGTEGGDGGDTRSGKHNTISHNQKVSKALTGHSFTPETLAKMRLAKLGVNLSARTREKISSSLKGRVFSEEHRSNIRQAKLLYWKNIHACKDRHSF